MGIITKDDGKKNTSLMIRMPSNLAEMIDICVGQTHSSRPDYVIDGIRSFIHFICSNEAEIMKYIDEKKDAARDVKIEFYYESIKSLTQIYRNGAASASEKSRSDVSILLSIPKGLAAQIDRTVERTRCFRNHQEFIRSATVYLTMSQGIDNTNSMLIEGFLESNQSTKDLRAELERLKNSMEKKD